MKKVLFVGESWHVHVTEAKGFDTPASNPPDQDLGLLGVSHWASVRGPLPAPLDSPPRHIPALFFSMDECMTRPSPTKVPRGVLARKPGT